MTRAAEVPHTTDPGLTDPGLTGPGLTDDVFLGGRLRLLQPAKGYRAGLDAVLLAAAVRIAPGSGARVLDTGAGVGTAGLCVAARVSRASVTLVERAPVFAALARGNVARNDLGTRVRVIETEVGADAAGHEALGLGAAAFDHVIANPPYLEDGRHRFPVDPLAAGACGMAADGLEHWLRFMARAAAPTGELTLIHRSDALAKVLDALDGRFGGIGVLPIHPRSGHPAHRIIVTGRKGSRAPLQLLPGLVLHGTGNAFLPAIDAIFRDGAPLAWPGAAR